MSEWHVLDGPAAGPEPWRGEAGRIPINTAIFVAGHLITSGHMKRAYLGVAGENVPIHRALVRHLRMPLDRGINVVSVEPGSPAMRAGVRSGDLIVAFEGQPIAHVDALHHLLTEQMIGRPVALGVVRGIDPLDIVVTPGATPQRETEQSER